MIENCAHDYLMSAVATTPNVVGISADNLGFLFYKSGVLTADSKCKHYKTTHVVAVVGYNSTAETPYWLVKNSFGTDWGEDGYVRIAMTNEWPGVCGINYGPWAYPITDNWDPTQGEK